MKQLNMVILLLVFSVSAYADQASVTDLNAYKCVLGNSAHGGAIYNFLRAPDAKTAVMISQLRAEKLNWVDPESDPSISCQKVN